MSGEPSSATLNTSVDQSEISINRPAAEPRYSDETIEDEVQDEIIVPPDGGYGWVVVLAAFLSTLFVDGTVFSFGVLIDPIAENLGGKEHQSAVAWIGSLSAGFYLISGPLISTLANRFGFRVVAIGGGVLAAASFIISSLVSLDKPNMIALYVCYGVLGGTGCGAIYLPAVLAVGFYFDKKRAMASGIALCGSGVGTFLFPLILEQLVVKIKWQGALYFLTGVIFCGGMLGLLYKPLKPIKVNRGEYEEQIVVRQFGSIAGVFGMRIMRRSSTENHSEIPTVGSSHSKDAQTDDDSDDLSNKSSELITSLSDTNYHQQQKRKSSDASKYRGYGYSLDSNYQQKRKSLAATQYRVSFSADENEHHQHANQKWSVSLNYSELPAVADVNDSKEKKKSLLIPTNETENHQNGLQVQAPDSPEEIFSTSSEIPKMNSSMEVQSPTSVEINNKTKKSRHCHCFRNCLKTVAPKSLLKSPTFILWIFSGFVFMLAAFVPYIYLKKMSIDRLNRQTEAIKDYQATLLISIIGIGTIVGKLLFAYIAGLPKVNPFVVFNLCTTLMGLSTALVPLYNHNYWGLVSYSMVYGLSMGGWSALLAVFMIQLLGLKKLTQAFGITELFFGIGSMLGSPLAGFLIDQTGSYNVPFIVAGVLLIASAVILFPINLIKRWESKRNKRNRAKLTT